MVPYYSCGTCAVPSFFNHLNGQWMGWSQPVQGCQVTAVTAVETVRWVWVYPNWKKIHNSITLHYIDMPSTPLTSRMEDIYSSMTSFYIPSGSSPAHLMYWSCANLSSLALSSDVSPLFQTLPEVAPAFLLMLESPSSVKVALAIATQAPQVWQSAPLSSIPCNCFLLRLLMLESPLTNKQPPHIVEAFLTV